MHGGSHEQVGGTGTAVIVTVPLGLAGPQRQYGAGAGRRLDLRRLIHTHDEGAMRRFGVGPIASRSLSMKAGSVDSLKLSTRCGCRQYPAARRLSLRRH